MRPKSPNRSLSLLKPHSPRPSEERAAREPGEPDAEQLLRLALDDPSETARWRRLYATALKESRYELATRAAQSLGDEAPLFLAEIAIHRGHASEAILILKDRSDAPSRSMTAWALFCMGQRLRAAALWMMTGDAEESELGRILTLLAKNRKPDAEIHDGLRGLSSSSRRPVAAAAAKLAAEIHLAAGDHAKALTWARRAEWLMPFDITLKRLIARTSSAAKQPDQALMRWREILAILPDDVEAHEMIGQALLTKNDAALAASHFEKALAIDPFRGHLRVLLGDMARDAGRMDDAIEHWATAFRVNPKDRSALTRLAETSWDQGDIQEALEYYLRLKELGFSKEEDEEHLEMIGYLYSEVLLGGSGSAGGGAAAVGETKRAREAAAFFADSLKSYPDNPFLRIYEARRLVTLESFEAAEKLIESALQIAPLLPEAIFEMGNLKILKGDFDGGMALLHRAAGLDPDPFYRKELGRNHLDHGDWAEAEKWFKRGLSSGIEDEEILLGLYLAVFNQKKYALSENILRRAIALSPDNMQALVYLAETLIYLAKYDEALMIIGNVTQMAISYEDFMEAGEGSPELVVDPYDTITWLMGYANLFVGKTSLANRWFGKAMKTAPDLEEWFVDLKALVRHEIEANKKLSPKLKGAIILKH
jgi:tetratricopeptide (TPR) repeat protein